MSSQESAFSFNSPNRIASSILNSSSRRFASGAGYISSPTLRYADFPRAGTLTPASPIKGVIGKALIVYDVETKRNKENGEEFQTVSLVLLDQGGNSVTVRCLLLMYLK